MAIPDARLFSKSAIDFLPADHLNCMAFFNVCLLSFFLLSFSKCNAIYRRVSKAVKCYFYKSKRWKRRRRKKSKIEGKKKKTKWKRHNKIKTYTGPSTIGIIANINGEKWKQNIAVKMLYCRLAMINVFLGALGFCLLHLFPILFFFMVVLTFCWFMNIMVECCICRVTICKTNELLVYIY